MKGGPNFPIGEQKTFKLFVCYTICIQGGGVSQANQVFHVKDLSEKTMVRLRKKVSDEFDKATLLKMPGIRRVGQPVFTMPQKLEG